MNTKKGIKKYYNLIFGAAAIAVVIGVWFVAAAIVGEGMILPDPLLTVSALFTMMSAGSFWAAFGLTFLRSVVSFLASLVLAYALAVASYLFPILKKLLSPIVTILRAVPTMAIIFLLILWAGSSLAAVLVSVAIVLPMLYSGFSAAISETDVSLTEMSKVYRVPKKRMLAKFVLPGFLPSVIELSASGLSMSVKLVVAAEALAQTAKSLGQIMQLSNIYLETARLMAVALVVVVLCLILEAAVRQLSRLLKWKKGDSANA